MSAKCDFTFWRDTATHHPEIIPKARQGQRMLQWKCRESHRDCAAKTWRNYIAVDKALAKDTVAQLNAGQAARFFKFRISPQ